MPFNVKAFLSQVNTGVRPNLFKVTIGFPGVLNASGGAATGGNAVSETITMLCKSGALPSSNMGTIEVPFRGRNIKIPGDRTFDAWTATFVNDPNFTVRSTFEKWMNYVNKLDANLGTTEPAQMFSDITIQQLNKAPFANSYSDNSETAELPVIRVYKLIGAWPSSVSQISLGYDQNDQVEEFDVEFQYQYFNVSGGPSGSIA